jgi:hypothetical protein
MEGVEDNQYNFVHSSHCLEHLNNVYVAMSNWIRITKPGGFIIVTVPDEDMYEHLCWPSPHNPDHKWSFTIYKTRSKMPRSINIVDLCLHFADQIQVEKIQQIRDFWVETKEDLTQKHNPECAIEFVFRKNSLPVAWEKQLEKSGIIPKSIEVSDRIAEHPFPEKYLCDGKIDGKTDKWAVTKSEAWAKFCFNEPTYISQMSIYHAGILECSVFNTKNYDIIFGNKIIQIRNNTDSFTTHEINATVTDITLKVTDAGGDGFTRIYEVKFL